MSRSSRFCLALAAALLAGPTRAWAEPFDLIYVDHMDFTLCPSGCGFTPTNVGYALLVNEGASAWSASTLYSMTFTSVSSVPSVELSPFLNDGDLSVAPVLPNEAVGSIASGGNDVLLTKLLPGETHRNVPHQFLSFTIFSHAGYTGPVVFDVTAAMGGDVARYSIGVQLASGSPAFSYLSASRVSSAPIATASATDTWGGIKALYRR